MNRFRFLLWSLLLFLVSGTGFARELTIAAASDLQFALVDMVQAFEKKHPGDNIQLVFGSSGKLMTQIQQGAPFDVYFSADEHYPQLLEKEGMTSGPIRLYGMGRLVVWPFPKHRKGSMSLLLRPQIKRIAIANPRHAPYGQRAVDVLKAYKVYSQVAPKLVYGENISQAAQFVKTGNAQMGLVALSLALNPELKKLGSYWLIPQNMHPPLRQAFVKTRWAKSKVLADQFMAFVTSSEGKRMLSRYGFQLPVKGRGSQKNRRQVSLLGSVPKAKWKSPD